MEWIHGSENVPELERFIGRAVTIGNFDGVHRGHQQLISKLVALAASRQYQPCLYTFRPHPVLALRPDTELGLLMSYDEKMEALQLLPQLRGVEGLLVEEPFSREFSSLTPEMFVEEILIQRLKAKLLMVGYDFAFGRGRQGDLAFLRDACARRGVEIYVLEAQGDHGQVISSTAIRGFLRQGDVEGAARLLGYPFFYRGVVVKGDGRGRQLGFPTANVLWSPSPDHKKLEVPFGVYGAEVSARGSLFVGIVNWGRRPTFKGAEAPPQLEVHLLDFDGDLYGESLEVRLKTRIRDERAFKGVDSLKAQIVEDIRVLRTSMPPSS